MAYLRIAWVFFLVALIVWWAFFSWVLSSITQLISWANSWFVAYLPSEAKAIVIVLFFSIIFGLAYSFFRQ